MLQSTQFLYRVELGTLRGSDHVPTQYETASRLSYLIERGRYLDFNNKLTMADLLVSCFHYMGFEDVQRFGDDRLNEGAPLPGLTA